MEVGHTHVTQSYEIAANSANGMRYTAEHILQQLHDESGDEQQQVHLAETEDGSEGEVDDEESAEQDSDSNEIEEQSPVQRKRGRLCGRHVEGQSTSFGDENERTNPFTGKDGTNWRVLGEGQRRKGVPLQDLQSSVFQALRMPSSFSWM